MIKAVIFDFGGVLCFPPTDPQFESAARTCGLPVDDFLRAFWGTRPEYDAGLISAEEYWRGIARVAGREVDRAWIGDMVRLEIDFWSNYDGRVVAWVRELRAQGLRTGILSNLPQPLGRHLLADQQLLKHFDCRTFSYELELIKPDAAIYEDMIQGLGIAPEEGLFFDDRPENVEGARAVGLQAELFVSWENLIESAPARYGLPAPATSGPHTA
jgi:putative hydrolase of the HAD superfamily